MFNAIKLLISYSSIRVFIYIVIVVLFTQFFIRVLLKKKLAIRVASILLLAAFVLSTALIPVENLLLRHSTPTAAIHYSFPNDGIIKSAEYQNWAAVQFDSDKTAYVRRDNNGWQTVLPVINEDNVKTGYYKSIFYMVKKLDTGVYYVGVWYSLFADPKNNGSRVAVETLADSNGSHFDTYERDIFYRKALLGHETYFYTFTDAGDEGYRLIINGEEVTP